MRYRLQHKEGHTLCHVNTAQQAADVMCNLESLGAFENYIVSDTRPGTAYPHTTYKRESVGVVGTPFKTMEEALASLGK